MKNKKFDCVEMKRMAQRKLREEFKARENEFASYFEFLRAKANESKWASESKKTLQPSPAA